MNYFVKHLFLLLRKLRIFLTVSGKSKYLKFGSNLHLGANVRLWAPNCLTIGKNVYIGKDTHIECDTVIGDNCLIANKVAFVGRKDHDYRAIGIPVRFAPWIGEKEFNNTSNELVELEGDNWIGFGAIVLTGVKIGKGSIIGAGAVVVHDIPDYSIAAGVPAKVIGSRFNEVDIKLHEKLIETGEFEYSLLGLEYSVIKPGKISNIACNKEK